MESNDASICPLCRQEKVKIFAVGECSHPVCYLCSTKMRILCEQTYCAICRQELPRVYFVSKISDTEPTIDQSRFTPIDETGDCGIYYPIKSEWIRRETEKLLRNFCPFCYYEYETFEILRDHVRRTHRYFYCDLCVENLNLFPYERKCYTRHDLVQHIRCGDRDDTSFKGHPICQFCDDHFVDDDQLYKHMRKEHYYCHLCTNDNVYYSDFDLLRGHYRKNHYLCELDQCKDVQFTNVFSSDFEFRAHQAAQHGKTRAQAKQLGTIPVEFQSRNVHDRRQTHDPAHRGTFKSGKFNTEQTNKLAENESDAGQQEPAVAVTVPSIDEFPILTERSSTPQNVPHQRGAWSNDVRGIHSSDDFPALTSATNMPITNAGQPKGIWREQQQQQAVAAAASNTQSTTSKKASQATKSVTSEIASVNVNEDFPALKSAGNTKIPPPVSMFSAWSTAKKTAKNANANAKANQPQTRMNANRLAYDDEDEEYIRRPMASLMTSTTSMASSNITMISSSDVSGAQVNEKQNKNKNQSLPNAQDFPALPSTNTPSNSTASGVWTATGTNKSEKSSTTQQKKKSSAASKKKFMEEVQALPPALSSNEDFPTFGLSELGRRLITEENQPTVTTQVKEEKPLPSPPSSTTTKQEKKEEKKSAVPSNKKQVQKATKTNDSVTQELPSRKDEIPVKPITNQASSVQNEPIPQAAPPPPPSSTQPPPGFAAPLTVSPPPGFNPMPSSQPVPLSYIYSSTYPKQKDEFRAKLFTLFDGDINLVLQYDQFCEAFSQNTITSKDFIEFTTRLFNDKLDQYLLELIMIIPNIEQQNELYSIWEKDIHPSTTQNANNWTKKNHMENNVHKCRICQQIMFETDTIEHNIYHPEFNTQFPSLSTAAIPIGRSNGKKNK